MAKETVKMLDNGQLDAMWSMLKVGGVKASKNDVKALIESTDSVRQMLIQKTAGQRNDDPGTYVSFDDLETHINIIVCCCLALRASGAIEKLLDIMENITNAKP